jgi:hypothetical protein
MEADSKAVATRRTIQLCVAGAVGVAVALLFQAYLVATWPSYVRTVDAERLRQLGGVSPAPFIASTPLSAIHGFGLLLIAGAAATAFTKRRTRWLVGGTLALSAGLTNLVLWSLRPEGIGNLWPISFVLILALSVTPAMLGTACSAACAAMMGVRGTT